NTPVAANTSVMVRAAKRPTERKNGPPATKHQRRYDQFKIIPSHQQPAKAILPTDLAAFAARAKSLSARSWPAACGARLLVPTAFPAWSPQVAEARHEPRA